ncbi:voltage-gated potassium channel [Bradyrhizobium ottawaense]
MSKPLISALAQFAAATAGRNMTKAAYVAVTVGVLSMVLLSDKRAQEAHGWFNALLWTCLAYFVFEWLVRLRHMTQQGRLSLYMSSSAGLVDAIGALAVPVALLFGAEPKTAWLLSVLWVLKVVPGIPGLRQLRRVLVLESGPLVSVLVIFLMVVFLASVAEYFLERDVQPQTFGSVPAALWWAVVTLTTTGYGDVVPVTPLGRIVAAAVMISGLGVFGLWTGILATGFAAETRRDNFLKTWESVSKVPFFAALGPAAIADVTHMLRTMELPARTMIIRKGAQGDCMYFIARGRGRGRTARQEGPTRRRRLLRRDGAARQQQARRQRLDHESVAASGARPRRLPRADGTASRSRRDHRRRGETPRARKQIKGDKNVGHHRRSHRPRART